MKFNTEKATVLSVFCCAIAYGDYTGLENDEIEALEDWLTEADDLTPGIIYDFGADHYFGECEVMGCMGDVVDVAISIPVGRAA